MVAMTNDERASWKITSRLEMKPLLIAVNGLAGLAIFFSVCLLQASSQKIWCLLYWLVLSNHAGYDQGMMGGVNDSEAYVSRMDLKYKENGSVIVTNTLL